MHAGSTKGGGTIFRRFRAWLLRLPNLESITWKPFIVYLIHGTVTLQLVQQISHEYIVLSCSIAATNLLVQKFKWREEPAIAILASVYVHAVLRRLVPNLATELHLTIRLLHVHPNASRVVGATHGEAQRANGQLSSLHGHAHLSDTKDNREVFSHGICGTKNVFETGLDCRAFAARVLLGLKSLLPHMGTDTLDLLASTLNLASEVRNEAQNSTPAVAQREDDVHTFE